jgi:hypothetical protein
MTKLEYAAFRAAFDAFMTREGIENLSSEPDAEPFFTWRPCECCGTPLGGNREKASGYNRTTKEVQTYTVCTDCIYYAAYGCIDDESMPARE